MVRVIQVCRQLLNRIRMFHAGKLIPNIPGNKRNGIIFDVTSSIVI
jgi:hypothetical protein